MAYKFQLGAFIASGSLKQELGLVDTDVDDATAAKIVAQIDNGEIAIAKLAAKTISGKDLGANLDSLSVEANKGLSMSAYNGSAAVANLKVVLDANGGLEFATGAPDIRLKAAVAGDGLAHNNGVLSVRVDDSSIETNGDVMRVKASGVTNAMLAGSIADSKLSQIQAAGKVALSALDIDAGTDIGAALADADLFIVDDGAGGTNRKSAMSRVGDYARSKFSANVAGGGVEGNLTYNAGSGQYELTKMTEAELRAHLSVADTDSIDMSYSGGAFSGGLKLANGDALEIHSGGGAGLDLKDTIAGNRTFSGNIIVSGDLTVNGSQTILNVATLEVEDKNIVVAKGNNSAAGKDGAGLIIQHSGGDDVTFQWLHANNRMELKMGAGYTDIKAQKFIGTLEGSVALPVTAIGNANGNLVAGMNYGTTDLDAARTWTLPQNPAIGDTFYIKAPGGVTSANNLKIERHASAGGHRIDDGRNEIFIESPYAAITVVYCAADKWRVM